MEDREEEPRPADQIEEEEKSKALLKAVEPAVDTEAAWIRKAGKLRYGYKKHVVTCEKGLVLGVVTTAANVNEISNLEAVLKNIDLPAGTPLFGE